MHARFERIDADCGVQMRWRGDDHRIEIGHRRAQCLERGENLRLLTEQFDRAVTRQFGIRAVDVADGHEGDIVPANLPQFLKADDVPPPHAATTEECNCQCHAGPSYRIEARSQDR